MHKISGCNVAPAYHLYVMLNKKAMKEEVTSSSLKNVGCISNSTSISKFYHKNSLMSSIYINI